MNRRHLLALGLAVAVLVSVGGTGGFGSTNAGRSVEVAVVDDEAAYLGIAGDDASNGKWNVTVTNRLAAGKTLSAEVEVDGLTATATSIGSGESETLRLSGVDCGDPANVTAMTTDGSVRIEASREVTCSVATGTPTPTATPTTTTTPTSTETTGTTS